MQRNGIIWMGWWYLAIAVGFAMLAIQHVLAGGAGWLIWVRVIIAAGFGILSWMEFRNKGKRR